MRPRADQVPHAPVGVRREARDCSTPRGSFGNTGTSHAGGVGLHLNVATVDRGLSAQLGVQQSVHMEASLLPSYSHFYFFYSTTFDHALPCYFRPHFCHRRRRRARGTPRVDIPKLTPTPPRPV